jgi:hypothetical protein
MDAIYYAAWETIIAISGETSDAGWHGLHPGKARLPQWGDRRRQILTLPPVLEQIVEGAARKEQ